jgi:hypothetical protein
VGQSIPLVCPDWANTKAADRFFSNDRVNEVDILSGHFASTNDMILMLHDTTEFTFKRDKPELDRDHQDGEQEGQDCRRQMLP